MSESRDKRNLKALVRNKRNVQTGVWIGDKRYVFPARIQVRMNLTSDMLAQLQRNPAFDVSVISYIASDTKPCAAAAQTAQAAQTELAAPAAVSEPINEEPKHGDVFPVEEAEEIVSETENDAVSETEQDSPETVAEVENDGSDDEAANTARPDFFTMKKEDLARYLSERGVDPTGMSRRDMLRKAKTL